MGQKGNATILPERNDERSEECSRRAGIPQPNVTTALCRPLRRAQGDGSSPLHSEKKSQLAKFMIRSGLYGLGILERPKNMIRSAGT